MIMDAKSSIILVVLISISTLSFSQNEWEVGKDYIIHNNNDIFLNGVNYVPPKEWMFMLDKWDEAQAEKDIAGMKSLGVKCVRFFPLWNTVQPEPNQLDEQIMQRIDRILELGAKYGLYYQITPLTGWMSGGTFLPDWATGNIFTDPEIIEGEKYLVKSFAERYKDNPALQGFDFGNEINVLVSQMKLDVTPAEIDVWMQTIYKAFKEGDPDCIITNGIGTGFDPYFNIEAISKSSDYMSVHSYPFFHGTHRLDPSIGQRTMYSGNFITEWAAMVNKPVLLQENGTTRPGKEAAKTLRIYYISSWAEGAAGYFWWGSHMIEPAYIVHSPGLRVEYSIDAMKEGNLRGDKTMGLLSVENIPETSGLEYKKCTEWVGKLDVGWKDKLPVCYIIVPHTTEFYNTMLKFITPFTLAKQAHFDVKLLWEDQKVPDDASAVFISGFQLSSMGKINIGKYLNSGGKVFQSFYNDLSTNIEISDQTVIAGSLTLSLNGDKNEKSQLNSLKVQNVTIREITVDGLRVSAINNPVKLPGHQKEIKNLFVKSKAGKGAFYYLAMNPEESLGNVNNPWSDDDSYLFYEELKPETEFDIDNRLVEFYHKVRGKEEILVLINHENSSQNVSLLCKNKVAIENAVENNSYGKNDKFHFKMDPAGVLILRVL